MKKCFLLLLICSLFTACGSDNDTNDSIMLSQTSCNLDNETSYVIIDIREGAGEYRIVSSNETVVKGLIEGNKIYVWGFNQGDATLTITDSNNNKAIIQVAVNVNITRPLPMAELVFVKKGETIELKYEEASSYDVMIDDNGGLISALEIDGGIAVTGEKVGENASIQLLSNMWPVHQYNIIVLDKYDLIVYPHNDIKLTAGQSADIYIRMGNGNYILYSSDETVAKAEILESLEEPSDAHEYYNSATIHIQAKGVGVATINLTDKEGQSLDIEVTVI